MKLKTIAEASGAIQKLAEQEMSMPLLYRVTKLFKKLREEIQTYDKMRHKVLRKYCNIADGLYVPREECIEALNAEWAELESIESEVEIGGKIKISPDEKIRLSFNDICLLEEFFEIEPPVGYNDESSETK